MAFFMLMQFFDKLCVQLGCIQVVQYYMFENVLKQWKQCVHTNKVKDVIKQCVHTNKVKDVIKQCVHTMYQQSKRCYKTMCTYQQSKRCYKTMCTYNVPTK